MASKSQHPKGRRVPGKATLGPRGQKGLEGLSGLISSQFDWAVHPTGNKRYESDSCNFVGTGVQRISNTDSLRKSTHIYHHFEP